MRDTVDPGLAELATDDEVGLTGEALPSGSPAQPTTATDRREGVALHGSSEPTADPGTPTGGLILDPSPRTPRPDWLTLRSGSDWITTGAH